MMSDMRNFSRLPVDYELFVNLDNPDAAPNDVAD